MEIVHLNFIKKNVISCMLMCNFAGNIWQTSGILQSEWLYDS